MKDDPQKERRQYVATTARELLARHWPNVAPGFAADAVKYALHIADELENSDCAPWGRTITQGKTSIPTLNEYLDLTDD